MKNYMNFICIILYFLVNCTVAHAQGSWDIDYLSIDSINNSFIGKEVRLDFKKSNLDTLEEKINVFKVRRLLSSKDTVGLCIDGQTSKFIESWKFYVDHGNLSDQILVSLEGNTKEPKIIKEMYLESVDSSALTLRINIYPNNPNNLTTQMKEFQQKKVVIDKSKIKGVLTRI